MFEGSSIRAVVFDLDGTLVETEHLKADAYARLVGDLTGRGTPEPEAVALYQSQVGSTDMIICDAMIERFGLAGVIDTQPGESDAAALHRLRMDLYRRSYGTPEKLRTVTYAHNMRIARSAASEGLAVGVATMSFSDEARRVLDAVGLLDGIDVVIGVDDVARPKPAPDAFLVAMEQLNVSPEKTLVVEDSPRGTQAAVASGARWVCVATDFSRDALKLAETIDREWIAWDPSEVESLVARRITAAG